MTATACVANRWGTICLGAAMGLTLGALSPTLALAESAKKPAPSSQPKPAAPAAKQAPAAPQPQPQPQQPQAAQQPPQGNTGPVLVAVKPAQSQSDWMKVCGKDEKGTVEICYTTRDFVSEKGQPALSAAVYDIKGPKSQKVVRFLMPIGMLIQPGIRFSVDQGQPTSGHYAMCLAAGCFAEAQVNDAFINALRNGTTLKVSTQSPPGRVVTFAVPAAGFANAFDGAPIDPQALQERQKQVIEEFERRKERLRAPVQGGATGQEPAPGANSSP